VTLLASLLNGLFDLLLWPVRWSRPVALAWVAALAGIGLLWLFKLVTPQQRLAAARRRVTGLILELGLWQDDLRTLLRIQGELLAANGRYLLTSLPSLLVLVPIFLVIVLQLEGRFGCRAPRPGETLLVAVELAEAAPAAALDGLALEVGPGLAVDAGPVRDRQRRSVWWRVRATDAVAGGDRSAAGGPALAVVLDGERWTKRLAERRPLAGLTPVRERPGWRAALLHPAEPPLPADAPLRRITAALPRAGGTWLGLPAWLWWFVLVSLAAGLAVKNVLHVEM